MICRSGNVSQEQVLTIITDHASAKGYAISLRELCAAMGMESTSSVRHRLDALRRDGRVDWVDGQNRTLHIKASA